MSFNGYFCFGIRTFCHKLVLGTAELVFLRCRTHSFLTEEV